jgi:hypothetical protein
MPISLPSSESFVSLCYNFLYLEGGGGSSFIERLTSLSGLLGFILAARYTLYGSGLDDKVMLSVRLQGNI